jgi:AcrR family transcriptional regulator
MGGGTPRWRRAPEDRREAILLASLPEFEANGFEPASMDAIAESAGLSKGSIYRYFRDKESLFIASLLFALDTALSHFRLGSSPDPDAAIRRLWQLASDGRFIAAYRLSLANPQVGSVGPQVSARVEEGITRPLAMFLRQSDSAETLSHEEALLHARLVVGSVLGAALMQLTSPESLFTRIGFLLRACRLDPHAPQADGF